jgi:hypothetical protein
LKGKNFKYKIDISNEAGIKEEFDFKINSNGNKKYKILIGIDEKFNVSKPYIFKKGKLIPIENPKKRKRRKGKPSIYYPLNEVFYMCEVEFVFENDKCIEINLKIFVPKGIISKDEICFDDITREFTSELKTYIINNVMQYSLIRASDTVSNNGITQKMINNIE